MLRRKLPASEIPNAETPGFISYPSLHDPFALGAAPAGIHFYRPKEAFYLPYASLQVMRLDDESLTILFATDEVIIEGRGLHSVYAQIANQNVSRVHEQGERFEESSEAPIFIRRIRHQARSAT